MKSSIFNKKEVPAVHPGCSLAETGRNEYDDFDNPLKPFNLIPEEEKEVVLKKELTPYECDGEKHVGVNYVLSDEIVSPSQLCKKSVVIVAVPSGVHPITFLKENGIVEGIEKAWIFLNIDVIETLRKLPIRFYHDTVAYGEFFRFPCMDEVVLQ